MCGDAQVDLPLFLRAIQPQAIVTDPPYGIGFTYVGYEDSREAWFALMERCVPLFRVLAPVVIMPCSGIDRLGWWYEHFPPDWLVAWYKGSPGHRSAIGFNDWEPHLIWGKPPQQMHDYFQTRCGFEVEGHPCPKPVEYAEWLIERLVEKAGILCDPFLGSGTTLIACERLGRVCYGMEIEPQYCGVAIERWQNYTGRKAEKVS